jgi:hypothetical protein
VTVEELRQWGGIEGKRVKERRREEESKEEKKRKSEDKYKN